MNNTTINFKEYQTIIYTPTGYFGSKMLWNDPSYAFQNRFDTPVNQDKWDYLTSNRSYLAEQLEIDISDLPEWDYENIEVKLK